jgi:nucleoside-diphosphate-sugar epimerase
MRAFVFGATGYVGRALVRRLAADGDAVVAHVRPDSPRLDDWRARFAALGARVDATPWDETALADTLERERPDVVYALLGTTRARGRAAARRGVVESYETVDYGLTAMLLRAAAASERRGVQAPRIVYLSAAGVSPGTRNPYLAVRVRVERELRDGPLPFVIVRPSFITGPDRDESRPAERIGAVAADALLRVAGWLGARRLRDRWRSMTADDLARALARLGRDPAAIGRVVTGEMLR